MNWAEFKETNTYYWTSGTNDGFGCELTYGFCSTNTLLYQNFSNWSPNEPSHPLTERCVTIKLDVAPQNIGFNDLTCSNTQNFICKGVVPDCTPTCPSKSNCKNDTTLFNSKGEILETLNYGRYATGCGKSFMFSVNTLSWDAANTMCCRLGMQLVSIEDDAKMRCIYELNKNDTLLKYTSEFWTSGTQLDCNFRYKFCSSGASILRNDTKWLAGEPNNIDETQWCVASRFAPTATLAKDQNYLFDAACGTSYKYICEMPAKPCNAVSCYDYNNITDPAKVSQFNAMSGPDGQFRTFCGRKYFLHKDSKSYKDAYNECSKFGMELVSMETNAEAVCIKNGFLSAYWYPMNLWSSGTSNGVGCVRSYGWCPSGTLIPANAPWSTNQPDGPYVESCLEFDVDQNIFVFNDNSCWRLMRFLCEQRS
ncbi:uncharacterized protein LOC132201914 [Neocloeon triangulifer]|uniref:uncharacterized protein LOC132201914 n=1 Tax=Neocloeon triangulifer TaxID=2078957 RepID=UPI00286F7AF6|nr:uncharacterized protein LOC132201914 [Neocloeon triangulifer]